VKSAHESNITLPVVIDQQWTGAANSDELLSGLSAGRESLAATLREAGALLFRGFPGLSIAEFSRFACGFADRELLNYFSGASPRTQLGGGGFHPSVFGDEFYREYLSAPERHKLRLNVRFGDGGEIDVRDLDHIRGVIKELSSATPWREGDILVVDNMLACHGRNPFTGSRKIALAMA
jgi:hypothetical protein